MRVQMKNKYEKINKKDYLLLHGGFFLFSFSAIFLKAASAYEPLTFSFLTFWGLALLVLFVYAALWQIILQKFPLSTAFANRGVVVVWGILWGMIIFGEQITLGKTIAAILIVTGIVILGKANG
jgi:drug/metabolite transporter (DMT)-like permease